jgi:Flp pilus assembly protein TadB
MNEPTTYPRSSRRHPRAVFGRIQIYGQNNPRSYAIRCVLVAFPAVALIPSLTVGAVAFDDWRPLMVVLAVMAVSVLVVGALLVLFMPWFVRRTLGTSTLPPDTDPVDLLEAKRQLRRGGLHESDDVNRAARVVAAQAESKMNSPKTVNIFSSLGALFFGALAVLTYLNSGTSFDFWFRTAFALLFVAYLCFLGPWMKRYRQRARAFAELYDSHRLAGREARVEGV